jgi:hypothetical protein
MRRIFVGGLVALGFLLCPITVLAAQFMSGDTVTVDGAKTPNENFYAAGGTVSITGAANGDVYAVGGNISLDGTVAKDAVLAGGTLVLHGAVNDDVRAVGGNVWVNNKIGGEAVLAGGNINVAQSASTSKSLTIAGGQVMVDGSVGGKTTIYGGQVTLRGHFTGPVTIEADKLTIESTAVVQGPITYKSPQEATVQDGAQLNGITYTHIERRHEPRRQDFGALFGIAWFVKLLMTLVLALVVYAVFKNTTARAVEYAGRHIGWSLLTGFIALVVAPIAIIILLVTIIGIPLAAALGATYVLALLFGKVVGAIFIGSWIWKAVKKLPNFPVSWLIILIGVLIYSVLWWIPVLGWLIDGLLFLVGLGSVILFGYESCKQPRV